MLIVCLGCLSRIIKDELIVLDGAVRAPGKIWVCRFY